MHPSSWETVGNRDQRGLLPSPLSKSPWILRDLHLMLFLPSQPWKIFGVYLPTTRQPCYAGSSQMMAIPWLNPTDLRIQGSGYEGGLSLPSKYTKKKKFPFIVIYIRTAALSRRIPGSRGMPPSGLHGIPSMFLRRTAMWMIVTRLALGSASPFLLTPQPTGTRLVTPRLSRQLHRARSYRCTIPGLPC